MHTRYAPVNTLRPRAGYWSGGEEVCEVGVERLGEEGWPVLLAHGEGLDDEPVDDGQQQRGLGLGVGHLGQVTLGGRGVEEAGQRDPELGVGRRPRSPSGWGRW